MDLNDLTNCGSALGERFSFVVVGGGGVVGVASYNQLYSLRNDESIKSGLNKLFKEVLLDCQDFCISVFD